MEKEYYHFKTETIDTFFEKDINDRDKHVICTCARGETPYIREWIEHYLNMGFEKIFICDNNNSGDNSLYEEISDYVNNGFVHIFDCRGFGSFQVQFYSMFCVEGNYKWCGYFDCDEFLEINLYSDIKDYLATKDDEICISFNWMVFGSNGERYKREGKLSERFPFPVSPISLYTENCFIKSIVRGGDIFKNGCWFNGSHIPMTTPMFRHSIGGYFHDDTDSHQVLPPRYKEGFIKHYYTKSFEEWINKSERGWPDGTPTLSTMNYFICNDWANLPIEQMANGLFLTNNGAPNRTNYEELLNEYDVIALGNPNKHIYAFITGGFNVIKQAKDKTFILYGDHIDDTIFNLFLEYGIKTGNRIVWANDDNEKWLAYIKYNKGTNNTYFILNFF